MKKSLVTGGAGFIGSHVVDALLEMGHEVVVLDDLSGGRRSNVNPSAEFIKGSVVDGQLVHKAFAKHKFSYVFHLAAYAAEGLSHFIKVFNYENNLIGSMNVLNAAINSGTVECFVFTSSIAVYGSNQLPMDETLTPEPEDSYGIAKSAIERELRISERMFGLPYVIFRPHNVYGERQNLGDRYRNVIGIFMNHAMKGQPFPVFGDGSQTRAFSHVADVAPVIAHSVERPESHGKIFNVGADTPYSILQLAGAVAEAMEIELQTVHLPERREVKHAYADHGLVRQVFGDLIQGITLKEGLRRMAAWAQALGPQRVRSFYKIEVRKGLPPSWEDENIERESDGERYVVSV